MPRGYIPILGICVQERFLASILSNGELSGAAASILQACATANIMDSQRRNGPDDVLRHLQKQMEFDTGKNVSAVNMRALRLCLWILALAKPKFEDRARTSTKSKGTTTN